MKAATCNTTKIFIIVIAMLPFVVQATNEAYSSTRIQDAEAFFPRNLAGTSAEKSVVHKCLKDCKAMKSEPCGRQCKEKKARNRANCQRVCKNVRREAQVELKRCRKACKDPKRRSKPKPAPQPDKPPNDRAQCMTSCSTSKEGPEVCKLECKLSNGRDRGGCMSTCNQRRQEKFKICQLRCNDLSDQEKLPEDFDSTNTTGIGV